MYFIRAIRYLLLLILATSASGLSVQNDSMSNELLLLVKEVWCNGINYTALCEGWRDLSECYGNVMQSELWSVKNNTDIYEYSPISLGKMLIGVSCEQQESQKTNQTDRAHKDIYNWIVVLVCLILIVAFLTISVVSVLLCKKCGSFEFGSYNATPDTSSTSVNETSEKI